MIQSSCKIAGMKFSLMLRYAGQIVFGYLLLLSISYGEQAYQPLFTILVGVLLWLAVKSIHACYRAYGNTRITRFLLAIVLLGGALRFLWAVCVPTRPENDFLFFHETALALSQGSPALFKNMGYPLLLSVAYRVYPDALTGRLVNALSGTLSIWLVYLTSAKLINRRTGLIAAFLVAIYPGEILMVNILGVEVVATTAVLATAFFLVRAPSNQDNFSFVPILFAGLCYGFGLAIRSSFVFYLPAILLWVLFIASFDLEKLVKCLGTLLAGVTVGLGVVVLGYSLIAGYLTADPLKTQDPVPILTGTNVEALGLWNDKDVNLYLSWPASQRDELARKEAFNRIKTNPTGFLSIIPGKIAILMGSNSYPIYWNVEGLDWVDWSQGAPRIIFIEAGTLISQAIYIFIWFFAFLAFKHHNSLSLPLAVVFVLVLSTLLPHIILEVQGRYQHYLMPFIVMLAAYGITGSDKVPSPKEASSPPSLEQAPRAPETAEQSDEAHKAIPVAPF